MNKTLNIKGSKIVITILTISLVLLSSTVTFATENSTQLDTEGETKVLTMDISNEELVSQKVAEAFEDENISHVRVIDPTLMEENQIDEKLPTPIIKPLATVGFLYRATNVKKAPDYIGKTVKAKTSGDPGTKISISEQKTIGCTFSASIGITSKHVTAAVGFNVTGSRSLSISGSYKVPKKKKVNNKYKFVKKGYLEARTLYAVKKFDTERKKVVNGVPGGAWQKYGSGTAKEPYGFDYHAYVTYK